jgi:hypothetical protein
MINNCPISINISLLRHRASHRMALEAALAAVVVAAAKEVEVEVGELPLCLEEARYRVKRPPRRTRATGRA